MVYLGVYKSHKTVVDFPYIDMLHVLIIVVRYIPRVKEFRVHGTCMNVKTVGIAFFSVFKYLTVN